LTFKTPTKNYFLKKSLAADYFLFTLFFKGKKSKRSHNTVGIKVFLTIFA